jgi:NAD(P)-dependent dehydrogenase (short-subunit alcohol dehydrogenase family)
MWFATCPACTCPRYCPTIIALLALLYARSLYQDRYKLRSFPIVATTFFPIPNLQFNTTLKQQQKNQKKIAIITGANSGVGFASTKMFTNNGVHVVMACRSMNKCLTAQKQLDMKGKSTCLTIDLASLHSVRQFAIDFGKRFSRLDILMLNGGIIAPHEIIQPYNIEKTFLVNYLSHFLLTRLLLPLLSAPNNTDARIVTVTSDAHAYSYKTGILSIKEMNDPTKTNTAQNYAQAKLANIMHIRELTYQLEDTAKKTNTTSNIFCNAAHPGLVATKLFHNTFLRYGLSEKTSSLLQYWFEHVLTTLNLVFDVDRGALTQVYLSLSEDVVVLGYRGLFFVPIAGVAPMDDFINNRTLTKSLYDMSMELTKEYVV